VYVISATLLKLGLIVLPVAQTTKLESTAKQEQFTFVGVGVCVGVGVGLGHSGQLILEHPPSNGPSQVPSSSNGV
jgi:hypothetical protein